MRCQRYGGRSRGGTTMAHSVLSYDPARRYDVKVEDVEYRRDGEQSWLALMYRP